MAVQLNWAHLAYCPRVSECVWQIQLFHFHPLLSANGIPISNAGNYVLKFIYCCSMFIQPFNSGSLQLQGESIQWLCTFSFAVFVFLFPFVPHQFWNSNVHAVENPFRFYYGIAAMQVRANQIISPEKQIVKMFMILKPKRAWVCARAQSRQCF